MRCGNPTSFPAYRFPLPSREVKIINFDLPHSKFTGVNECIVQYVRGEKKKKKEEASDSTRDRTGDLECVRLT